MHFDYDANRKNSVTFLLSLGPDVFGLVDYEGHEEIVQMSRGSMIAFTSSQAKKQPKKQKRPKKEKNYKYLR